MNRYQDKFPFGTQISISSLDSSVSTRGEIIANYGLYLVIKFHSECLLMPGQQVKVALMPESENICFDSYICFLDEQGQANNTHFCIYVPPALGIKEMRKYLRLNLELKLIYRSNGSVVPSKTINISAGGAYFFTPDRLYIGQEIELELYLPQDVLTLQAIVVRTMLNAASIEFLEATQQIDKLAHYLYRLSRS